MRNHFYNLLIMPLVAVSALLFFLHGWFPRLYGGCVRPLLMIMRGAKRVESVQSLKETKRPDRSVCFSLVFDSERSNVIRLIGLDSDYDEPEMKYNLLKESA